MFDGYHTNHVDRVFDDCALTDLLGIEIDRRSYIPLRRLYQRWLTLEE